MSKRYLETKNLLKGQDVQQVDNFISYCMKMDTEIDRKTGQLKNPYFIKLSPAKLAHYFKKVAAEDLVLDGKHITIQKLGLSYDYIAYKNKMLLAYPETILDIQLVFKGDKTSFKKRNGEVFYEHIVANPFSQKDSDIVGSYCVIKNKRGEFLTLMGNYDVAKHKRVARTTYVWDTWLKDMYLKTTIKKAVKIHFDDVFEGMNEEDNKQIDLEKSPLETVKTLN